VYRVERFRRTRTVHRDRSSWRSAWTHPASSELSLVLYSSYVTGNNCARWESPLYCRPRSDVYSLNDPCAGHIMCAVRLYSSGLWHSVVFSSFRSSLDEIQWWRYSFIICFQNLLCAASRERPSSSSAQLLTPSRWCNDHIVRWTAAQTDDAVWTLQRARFVTYSNAICVFNVVCPCRQSSVRLRLQRLRVESTNRTASDCRPATGWWTAVVTITGTSYAPAVLRASATACRRVRFMRLVLRRWKSITAQCPKH